MFNGNNIHIKLTKYLNNNNYILDNINMKNPRCYYKQNIKITLFDIGHIIINDINDNRRYEFSQKHTDLIISKFIHYLETSTDTICN